MVGGASMAWPVEDVGGDGEALWRVAFWWPLALSVASVMGGVKSSNTHTPPGRSWVGRVNHTPRTFWYLMIISLLLLPKHIQLNASNQNAPLKSRSG